MATGFDVSPRGRDRPADEAFSVSVSADEDGGALVGVVGEVDLATADQLWAVVIEAMTTWTGDVVVDLSGVTFLDSQGIRALIRTHKDCGIEAARLTLRSPSRQVREVFEITGIDRILRIED
jgi:anti-sigma B factor antagonist